MDRPVKQLEWKVVTPSSGEDEWHIIHVVGHPDTEPQDWDVDLLHPESCMQIWSSKPDKWGNTKIYQCPAAYEIEQVGYDTMFPDGLEPGWFRIRVWWHWNPSTPNGGGDMDAGVEVIYMSDAE